MFTLNIEFFGYFAAILTTLAFLPQLIKTLKTKKAEDVSLITLIMFLTEYCLGLFMDIKSHQLLSF